MWLRVIRPFNWTPPLVRGRKVTIGFKPGDKPVQCKRDCGAAAIARGDAEEAEAPGRAPSRP